MSLRGVGVFDGTQTTQTGRRKEREKEEEVKTPIPPHLTPIGQQTVSEEPSRKRRKVTPLDLQEKEKEKLDVDAQSEVEVTEGEEQEVPDVNVQNEADLPEEMLMIIASFCNPKMRSISKQMLRIFDDAQRQLNNQILNRFLSFSLTEEQMAKPLAAFKLLGEMLWIQRYGYRAAVRPSNGDRYSMYREFYTEINESYCFNIMKSLASDLQIYDFSPKKFTKAEEAINFLKKYIAENSEKLKFLDNYFTISDVSYIPEEVWDILVLIPGLHINSQNVKLIELPEQIGKLTRLELLRVWVNSLTSLPQSLANCTKLKEVILPKNKFVSFPDILLSLKELNRLNLSENQITELPSQVWTMPELSNLNLAGNQITALPPITTLQHKVKVLDFSNNQISVLPEGIENLNSLQKIDLRGNPVCQNEEELKKLAHVPEVLIR